MKVPVSEIMAIAVSMAAALLEQSFPPDVGGNLLACSGTPPHHEADHSM